MATGWSLMRVPFLRLMPVTDAHMQHAARVKGSATRRYTIVTTTFARIGRAGRLFVPDPVRAEHIRSAYVEGVDMDVVQELLTTAEVALLTRAPVSTVRYWRHCGTGPRSFRLGKRVVYRRTDVDRWLSEREADVQSSA